MIRHRVAGLNQLGPPKRVPIYTDGYLPRRKEHGVRSAAELSQFRERHGIAAGRVSDEWATFRQDIALAKGQAKTGKRRLPSLPRVKFLDGDS